MATDKWKEEQDARRDHSRGERRDYSWHDWAYNDEKKRLEEEDRKRWLGSSDKK